MHAGTVTDWAKNVPAGEWGNMVDPVKVEVNKKMVYQFKGKEFEEYTRLV